jgi:PAS domain S-box-containing protein
VLLGRRLADIIEPVPFEYFSKMFQRAIDGGQNEDLQYSITVAGKLRWFMLRVAPVADAASRTATPCLIARDITRKIKHMQDLQKSEALLAQAEEIANIGSWEFDLKTRKVRLSQQLLRMYGVASEAEWSEDIYWERMHPDDREKAHEIVNRGLEECKPFECVTRYLDPDWKVRIHYVRGLPLPGPNGKAERAIGVIQDITDRARAEDDLRRLSQQLLRIRDEDRRNVARELHESAGQSLAALKMTLGRLRHALCDSDKLAAELLQAATELADGAIREVRTISYLMHPPLLDEAGLGPALRWYAEGFSKRSGISVCVDVPDDFGRHSQEIETTVFRIVQEALTNVHRYSGSRTATIRLAREAGQIRVEVCDEGCGLPPSSLARNSQSQYGVGIAGMRERVKHLHGVFDLESTPGRGTTVRAVLPLPSPAPQIVYANHDEATNEEVPKT